MAQLEAGFGIIVRPVSLLTYPSVAELAGGIASGQLGTAVATPVEGAHANGETIPASQAIAAIYLGQRMHPHHRKPRG